MKNSFTATFILSIIFFSTTLFSQIYVSTTGNDDNSGTIVQPLQTIPAAVTKAQAGDTIYVRGGVYSLSTTISISKDGSADSMYYMFAYPGERPLLDFSSMVFGSSNRGVNFSADYWHVKGIDIKGAGDNGMNLSGSNNIIEFCSFFQNEDTGLQLSGGASDNRIINCDSYFNADPEHGNADGFAPKLSVGTNNYFYGCRAWQNSDDGWDGYLRESNDVSTILENCWCFSNGYLENGNNSNGNGNGYKMGGSDDKTLMHDFTIKNSLAFYNRSKGYDQNSNTGSMTLYNNTAFANGSNFAVTTALNAGDSAVIKNCVVLGGQVPIGSFVVQQTNSWQSPFIVNANDFISIDTAGVRGPRKPDGSLPEINFLRLAEGSDLIDAGTDIGLPFHGTKPDLGAFEFGLVVPVELTSFSAGIRDNIVSLKWITQTETNNLGFEIQRTSAHGSPFEQKGEAGGFVTIGFIPGAGSSSEVKEYHFVDKNVSSGIFYYRLKQIDYNGLFSYSDNILVSNISSPLQFSLNQNYPNPFNPSTSITYQLNNNDFVTLKVYDVLGNEVAVLVNEEKEAGTYQVKLNADILSSGIYIYTLQQGKNIQSRKMLLVK